MAKTRRFKEIEALLELRSQKARGNELALDEDDFYDGQLTVMGYHYLKQQCEYIDMEEYVKINVPKSHKEGLRERLEELTAVEYRQIKKDITSAFWEGFIFLILSVGFYFLAELAGGFELIFIACWVFGWTTVERWSFDSGTLKRKKQVLLQILSADLIEQK